MRIDLYLGLSRETSLFLFLPFIFFPISEFRPKHTALTPFRIYLLFWYCLQRILPLFRGLNLTSHLHRDQFFSLTLNRVQICLLQNLHGRPAMDWQLPLEYMPASELTHLSGILLSFYFCPLRIFLLLYSARHIINLKQFYVSFSSVLK